MNKKILIILFFSLHLYGTHPDFKLGIENISESFITSLSPGKPLTIGLITNQTGKDQEGRFTADILREKGIVIKYLFAPEHGLYGEKKAAETVDNGQQNEIPIISLYKHGTGTNVDHSCMADIDALFFDIQDSGMRHFTYISTLFYALECAAKHGKMMVVLDRPNPLGCMMEGPLVEPALKSFISIAEIPLRHGMTVGELAYFFNKYLIPKQAHLSIVPMKNYERTQGLGLQLPIALSPNITCLDGCYGYSFLGLLGEIKPFHVGIGTSDAFQIITLPDSIKVSPTFWNKLSQKLSALGIAACLVRVKHPKKKTAFTGVRIHITNINQTAGLHALLTVLEQCKKEGVALEFSKSFDKAVGTVKVREYIMGMTSKQELHQLINTHLQMFLVQAEAAFRYLPHPLVKLFD